MRYPLIANYNPELRTHEKHVNHVEEVKSRNITSDFGVKGSSVLLNIEKLDIVWSLPAEYMHGSLMGVAKQLYNFWITSKILSKPNQILLKERMNSIKLCQDLQRSLRPLNFVTKYKALEWKIWLLFVSVPCLHGILPENLLRSYLRFVNSIYTLLKEKITKECSSSSSEAESRDSDMDVE
ncbi:hypothetical protein TKK_0014606 [Trichogramma kaykai]